MLSAVTKELTGYYGDNLAVYNERPAQNAPMEYLFVHQLNREQTPDNGRFHNRFYFFDIRFHPDDKMKTQYHRFVEIVEELTEYLTYVATDDQPVKASSMRSEVQDGVLHFFVDYPVRVMLDLPRDPVMEDLDIKENLKE
jgi:hypothetical protein